MGPFPLSKPSFHAHRWNSSRAPLCPIACFGSRQENVLSLQTVSFLYMMVIGKRNGSVCLIWGFGDLISWAVEPIWQVWLKCQVRSRVGASTLAGPRITSSGTSERSGQEVFCSLHLHQCSQRCPSIRPSTVSLNSLTSCLWAKTGIFSLFPKPVLMLFPLTQLWSLFPWFNFSPQSASNLPNFPSSAAAEVRISEGFTLEQPKGDDRWPAAGSSIFYGICCFTLC